MWFELKGNSSEIERIANQVDTMGWTEDGHINIAIKVLKKRDELLDAATKLAGEKSLTPIIEDLNNI